MTSISTRLVALLSFLALTGCDLATRSADHPPTGRAAGHESAEPLDTAPADDLGALFYQEPDAWHCEAGEVLAIPFDYRRESGDEIYITPPQVMICYDIDVTRSRDYDDGTAEVKLDGNGERMCRTTTDFQIVYEMPIRFDWGRVVIQCQSRGFVMVYRAVVPARCAG